MLSGIGDPERAPARMASGAGAALPGVGKNLQDHISAAVAYRRGSRGLPPPHAARSHRARPGPRGPVRHGIASDLPTGSGVSEDPSGAPLPDVQFLQAAPMTALLSVAVRAVSGRLRLPCGPAAAGKPRRGRPRHRRSAAASRPAEFSGHRPGPAVCAPGFAWRRTRPCAQRPRRRSSVGGGARAEASRDAGLDAHVRATGITVHHPVGLAAWAWHPKPRS